MQRSDYDKSRNGRELSGQAREIFQEVEGAYRRGVWNLAVRRAQEVVELALKAALREEIYAPSS